MKKRINSQRGIVLVSAMIILASLTLIVVTVAHHSTMNELMAGNQRDAVNAMTIAESGIEVGFSTVRKSYVKLRKFKVDELLAYQTSPLLDETVSGGSYAVTFPSVTENYAVMNSLGNVMGAEREIEVILNIDGESTSTYAILTDDDINAISGDPEITGPYANVHSNSDAYIEGSPTVTGTVSASGSLNAVGNPDIGEQVSGAGEVDIPHVYPPDYEQYATVILTPGCRVTAPDGTEIANIAGNSTWHGWSCIVNEKWTMSGNPGDGFFEAFYYVKGNLVMSGSPLDFFYSSFVAEGYIVVDGNGTFRPWGMGPGNDTGDHVADEILFLAGNDLLIQGTPAQQMSGILAAHMEVSIAGNPTLEGSIVAENGKHGMGQEVTNGQWVYDLVSENNFDGSLVLIASGTAVLGGGNPVTVTAWRELVH